MPTTPNRTSKQHNTAYLDHHSKTSAISNDYHGILLLPSESLTHCTAYLDPLALLSLSLANKYFFDHVNNDITWHYAFDLHFLGIGPEADRDDGSALLLRRTESTWKKEYLNRFYLTRRWEKSHTTTITHTPHHSTISSVLLLPDDSSLLSSSLSYGVVSRSYPFTGKILKGFLDASGTLNGQGIGNPNAEFSPDVTTIALHSAGGGTVRVAWGFRSGQVALTTSPRVMELGKHGKLIRCAIADSHFGLVQEVAFGEKPGGQAPTFVSTGADGKVKLWEADPRTLRCAWTGDASGPSLVPDACVKVAYNAASGIVVTGMQSGQLVIFTGLDIQRTMPLTPTHTIRIPLPVNSQPSPVSQPIVSKVPQKVFVQPGSTTEHMNVLVHYSDDDHFYEISVRISDEIHISYVRFCRGPLGPLTSIKSEISTLVAKSLPTSSTITSSSVASLLIQSESSASEIAKSQESSFVLAGDNLGRVCVWDWGAGARVKRDDMEEVHSSTKFEAHNDGAVTAIEIGTTVIVTGSSRGTIKIWDSLTLSPLRSISAFRSRIVATGDLTAESVSHVVVRQDLLVASIGSKVIAWKASGLSSEKPWKVKGKKAAKSSRGAPAKWNQRLELKTDILESRFELDYESRVTQRSYSRERAQLSTLGELGLDEIEAVEYVLMLSRDEEEARRRRGETDTAPSSSTSVLDTTTEGDGLASNDVSSDSSDSPGRLSSPGSPRWSPAFHSSSSSYTKTPSSFTPTPIPSPRSYSRPGSSTKVQISPRVRPEPTEAGFEGGAGTSPLNIGTSAFASSWNRRSADHFPKIPPTSSSVPRSSGSGSGSLSTEWSAVVRRSSPSTSSITSPQTIRSPPTPNRRSPKISSSLLTAKLAEHSSPLTFETEDDELQYVLELSLAESKSSGHAV